MKLEDKVVDWKCALFVPFCRDLLPKFCKGSPRNIEISLWPICTIANFRQWLRFAQRNVANISPKFRWTMQNMAAHFAEVSFSGDVKGYVSESSAIFRENKARISVNFVCITLHNPATVVLDDFIYNFNRISSLKERLFDGSDFFFPVKDNLFCAEWGT